VEEERQDALEVEKEEDEKGDESPEAEEIGWEHGVARHHRGLQLGDD